MTTFPPRLHALLARESQLAVVIRRGPSRKTCTFLWDRESDTFTLGQWLRDGKIYERRSDISPDGKFLLYFAANYRWESETGGSWTAISRTPYLKAIDLYAKGDCWEGGGLFSSNSSYGLNDRYFSSEQALELSGLFSRDSEYEFTGQYGAESLSVYYPRLIRDGWKMRSDREAVEDRHSESVFELELPRGWTLKKIAHSQIDSPPGKGSYWDEHQVYGSGTTSPMSFPDWEWAERDGEDIVYAEFGCLYRRAVMSADKLGEPKLLHDFSSYSPTRVKVPY